MIRPTERSFESDACLSLHANSAHSFLVAACIVSQKQAGPVQQQQTHALCLHLFQQASPFRHTPSFSAPLSSSVFHLEEFMMT